MRTKLLVGAAIAAFLIPTASFAQSTGSQDFDDASEILVTGTKKKAVGGVEIPDSPKPKVVITSELIQRQRPGQSVNEIINLVPGVSFTNNDPWGSSGGSFTIRGFDSSRISQTFDGIPLNDSGNYAIYSNQQLDPELIENVNVNLGATDVDSPTASAVGGTVNINSLTPSKTLSGMAVATYGNIIAPGSGDRPFNRVFGLLQTGDITGHGTTAWFAASNAHNEAAFANYGVVQKSQYNAKIRQDFGSKGDFISLSGNYNVNRNNFGGSPLNAASFGTDKSVRFYKIPGGIPCNVSLTGTPNTCGTSFERRYNPSNNGNARINSRYTLAEGLVLSLDGAYQYVKANGGGTVAARESAFTQGTGAALQSYTGFFGGVPYYNMDLNGDGVISPTGRVTVLAPSQTVTNRYTGVANLAYDINPNNRIRLSYTYDRARHRQTGETTPLDIGGEPFDVFPINNGLADRSGNILQKRNRKSFATLNKVAAEYRGEFVDEKLTLLLGVSAPFYKRDLNQYCFTTALNGNVNCVAGGSAAAYQAANPYVVSASGTPTGAAPPQSRSYKYDKVLPNVGATFRLTPTVSVAASFAQNLSVPGTDTLYNSLYVPATSDAAQPRPETSNSYDLSLRYQRSIVQAALTGWYSTYKNRIVSAYDLDCDCSVDTNLGEVKKYGIDASVSVRPVPQVLAYVFGSYIKSDIQDNVATSATTFAATAGNYERAAPNWLAGGRLQGTLGDLDVGAQIKYTGRRYLNDTNTVKFGGYTVVDLDIRYSLASAGLDKTYLQLNVSNLFDEFYVGSFSGSLSQVGTSAFVNFGAPRAISGSLIVGF